MASVFAAKAPNRLISAKRSPFFPKSFLGTPAHNTEVNLPECPQIQVIHNFHRIIHTLMSTLFEAKNVEI